MKKDRHELISQPVYGIKAEKNVSVATREGIHLSANIFHPEANGKFPALLASSYGKEVQSIKQQPQPASSIRWRGATGRIYEYAIEVRPTSNISPKGHRIQLEIKSTDIPGRIIFEPNHLSSNQATLHFIYHDLKQPSQLLLPIIPQENKQKDTNLY